ncbi:MAG: hypothetical protein NT075_32575 [Chloroflexi bacterium]|nr:hypothetical protein [Chloroflexota bacterium]
MAKLFCPYVGTLDNKDNQAPPVDYPSFENHCLATDDNNSLLLTDQATFCLSNGYRYCARYQVAAASDAGEPETHFTPTQTWAAAPVVADQSPDLGALGLEDETPNHRRMWGWVGAGIIFLSVFLCGGVFAAYTGWQMVSQGVVGQSTTRVNTLANVATVPPPVYIVLTATSIPPVITPVPALPSTNIGVAPVANSTAPTTTFPVAVTPTAVTGEQPAITLAPAAGQNGDQALTLLPTLPPGDQAAPPVGLDQEIPTRRPTPIIDVPTSTPIVLEASATPLPTPTPPRGTPVVQFGSLEQQVMINSCTGIRWHVENVQSVYYENQPVQGDGEQEECIEKHLKTYKLAVTLFDGTTQIYTTTVMPLFPTSTVTPTPSFTPEIIPTETWTPVPPTDTPTPNIRYATTLAVKDGEHHTCSVGQCEIGLLVTNSGDTSDNISVILVQAGDWSAQLCRADGICSNNSLPLNGMGPSNTAYVNFSVTIPAEAVGQTASYSFRAISNGSNGAITSSDVIVTIEAQ